MRIDSKRTRVAIVAAVLAIASSAAAYGLWFYAPNDTIPIVLRYSQRQALWWKWALTQPAATHPLLDPTGQHCAQGQSGIYWFLGGTFDGTPVTRSCTIPFGRTVVFPILNESYLAFPSDPPEEQTETFVRAQNVTTAQATNLRLVIDGIPQHIPSFFVSLKESKLFHTVLSDVFGEDLEGQVVSLGADKGYYAALQLSPGTHRLEWSGTAPGNTQNVVYNITVR